MLNFRGNKDLCKLTKEYLNALLRKFFFYSLQHSETFDVSRVFLPLTNAELSTLKQVRFFWPTLYIMLVYVLPLKSINQPKSIASTHVLCLIRKLI